jgi:hypothetical protein
VVHLRVKVGRSQTKLLELIRDHRRRVETMETLRALGFGFKIGADGRVVPTLDDAIKDAMALPPKS